MITLHPTRVSGHYKTLIGDIFSKHILKEDICGNLTPTTPDHLLQFLIMASFFQTLLDPNPMSIKEAGPIKMKKSLYRTLLKKTEILFSLLKKMMLTIHLIIFF